MGKRLFMRRVLATLVLLMVAPDPWRSAHAASPAVLRFVGCPADGQSGPQTAPATMPDMPRMSPVAAKRLALYASAGLVAVAPRGWHCIEMYGSGGAFLLVTPKAYTVDKLPDFSSTSGPAVEFTVLNGENSSREDVAAVFARLFPSKRHFIRNVIATGALSDRAFALPRGPYPGDRTTRRNAKEVDYTTPPRRTGMGTFESRLKPDGDPIIGRATLASANGVDSVTLLNVRLPSDMRGLVPLVLSTTQALNTRKDRSTY